MREPDFVIGPKDRPYIWRWFLTPWSGHEVDPAKPHWLDWFKLRCPHVYLHNVKRSDDDRALHDHPWANLSIVLLGGYYEHVPLHPVGHAEGWDRRERRIWRGPGSIVWRRAYQAHRLEIMKGAPHETWTLFLTGPKVREWGFWCPLGWRHWKEFTAPSNSGEAGRGCGE